MHLVPNLEASSLDLLCLHTPVPLALYTIMWARISWAPLMGPRVASMALQVTHAYPKLFCMKTFESFVYVKISSFIVVWCEFLNFISTDPTLALVWFQAFMTWGPFTQRKKVLKKKERSFKSSSSSMTIGMFTLKL